MQNDNMNATHTNTLPSYDAIGKPALQYANTLGVDRPQDVDALVRYAAKWGAISNQDLSNLLSVDVLESVRVWGEENPLPTEERAHTLAVIARRDRGLVLFQASNGNVDDEMEREFEAEAESHGFDSEECGGKPAMLRMLRAGILPCDLDNAVESGRVFYCFELETLSIDGSTQAL